MKNITKTILLTIIAILISQTSFCQENYVPGYIVSKEDTIHGFIDYRNWEVNPEKIFFKEKSSDSTLVYTPLDIREFGVSDEIYVSATVETEVSPNVFSNLTYDVYYNPELVLETKTAFLLTIFKGKKSLYYYENRIGKDQFYIKQDSSYQLLVHKEYLTRVDDVQSRAENKKYLNQLSCYLMDCPQIISRIENTKYTRKNIERLFLKYYDCTQSQSEYKIKTEKTLVEYGVLSGLSVTSLSFRGLSYLEYSNKKTSANFTGGLFLEVIPPRNRITRKSCGLSVYFS